MSTSVWAMTVIMALGGGPFGHASGAMSYGGTTGGGIHSTGMGLNNYSGSNCDTLLPWDSQEAWMHGHFQEISPYSGYHFFRPYNYKHVYSQADLAYRWRQPQGMPYSQQWWHRYHQRASLNPQALTQAANSSAADMAQQRPWIDHVTEQQRVSHAQTYPMLSAPGHSIATPNPGMATAKQGPMNEPTTHALHQYYQGERAFVVPTAPVSNPPRSNDSPVILEYSPVPLTGPALR